MNFINSIKVQVLFRNTFSILNFETKLLVIIINFCIYADLIDVTFDRLNVPLLE
jgi:hypothetical protein